MVRQECVPPRPVQRRLVAAKLRTSSAIAFTSQEMSMSHWPADTSLRSTGCTRRSAAIRLRTGRRAAAILAAVVIFGVLSLGHATRSPGLYGDSAGYLGSAELLRTTGQLRLPQGHWTMADSTSDLIHWPPGFPVLIAAAEQSTLKPIDSAWLVVAVSAALSAGLFVVLLCKCDGAASAAFGLALAAATPALVMVHTGIFSEAPFMTAMVGMVVVMVEWPDRPLLYGLLAALSVAIRYAGLALAGAAGLFALLQPGGTRQRLGRAFLATLPTVCWWLLWQLHVRSGQRPVRRIGLHLASARHAPRELGGTVTRWLVPAIDATGPRVVLALVLGLALLWQLRSAYRLSEPQSPKRRLLHVCGVISVLTLLMLLATRLLLDPTTTFSERLLAPLLLLGCAAVAVSVSTTLRSGSRATRYATLVVALAWLAAAGLEDVRAWHAREAWDYASAKWSGSPVLTWIRQHGMNHPLYTNNPIAVYLYTRRASYDMPADVDRPTMRSFADTVARRNGLVVTFYHNQALVPPSAIGFAAMQAVAGFADLCPVARLADGVIWMPIQRHASSCRTAFRDFEATATPARIPRS